MATKWIPLIGDVTIENDTVRYVGPPARTESGQVVQSIGLVLSDQDYGGGTIAGDVRFTTVSDLTHVGFILYYEPQSQSFIEVQLGGAYFCSVWSQVNRQWTNYGGIGTGDQLTPDRTYRLEAWASGSAVKVSVDGVRVLSSTLPVPLPASQSGLYFHGETEITVSKFKVTSTKPKAFVVMQFTPPYNELYEQVIGPVCQEFGLQAERADEHSGPGVIIQDIERQILEARVVIADITPANLNVYYEVGFAHALKKDTILIAEKPTELPFDVSPFRILFYENSIAGKAKVEEGLRRHLDAIQQK